MTMKVDKFKEKQAYYAKVRRSNYEESLRLEGFPADPEAATKPVPSRAAVLQAYRKQVES
jgi:hypothetical protein